MQTKPKLIYTYKMAQELINQGFMPAAQAPNARDMRKTVWIFDSTPELEAACDTYIAASKRDKSSPPHNINSGLITKMHTGNGLSVADIAKITGKSQTEIQKAIGDEIDLYRLFAIGAMNDSELKELMAAQTLDERDRLILERMKRGGYIVYGHNKIYDFTYADECGEVSGNE